MLDPITLISSDLLAFAEQRGRVSNDVDPDPRERDHLPLLLERTCSNENPAIESSIEVGDHPAPLVDDFVDPLVAEADQGKRVLFADCVLGEVLANPRPVIVLDSPVEVIRIACEAYPQICQRRHTASTLFPSGSSRNAA